MSRTIVQIGNVIGNKRFEQGVVIPVNALKDNLMSVWEFEETSGTTFYDSHGNNDGTIESATLNVEGKLGKCFSYNGTSNYLSIPDHATLRLGSNSFTYNFWMTYTGTNLATDICIVFQKGIYNGGSLDQIFIALRGGNTSTFTRGVYANTRVNAGVNEIIGPNVDQSPVLQDGNWHMVTVSVTRLATVDATIYIDAQPVGTLADCVAVINNSAVMYIGRSANAGLGYWMEGKIDQLAFWKRGLSQQEVTTLYNSGAGIPYSFWTYGTIPSAITTYTIANHPDKYEAWPQLAKDSAGKIYMTYRVSDTNTHMFDATGRVVLRISSDNGITWGNEIVVANETNIDDRNMAILIFDNAGTETIMITYNTYNSSAATTFYSTKATVVNPNSWSSRVSISQGLNSGYGRGNPILLSNGKILAPFNTINNTTHVGETSNAGTTWTNYTVTPSYRQELAIIECKTNGTYQGKVFGIIRRSSSPYGFYEVVSTDYGHTWGAANISPDLLTDYPTPGEFLRWDDNTILFVTSLNNKVAIYRSLDEALTWTYIGYTDLPSTSPASFYPSIIKLHDSAIGTAWCENDANSDLYYSIAPYPPPL